MQGHPIAIVPAQNCHAVAIEHCARQAYQHYVARMKKDPAPMVADFNQLISQQRVMVALATTETNSSLKDELLGYVVSYPTDQGMHLENIAVMPSAQGHGVGVQLVNSVEQQARILELPCVHLYTNAAMHENFSWYESLGYVETERKNEDGFNRVFFIKILS